MARRCHTFFFTPLRYRYTMTVDMGYDKYSVIGKRCVQNQKRGVYQ